MKTSKFNKIATLLMILFISKATYSQTTSMVKDISAITDSKITETVVYKDYVYFSQSDDTLSVSTNLWRTDGTETGTEKMVNSTGGDVDNPKNFTVFNDMLYYSAFDTTYGQELWQTDGTTANTKRISDLNPGTNSSNPRSFVQNDTVMFFHVFDQSNGGNRIVKMTPSYGPWYHGGISALGSPEPKGVLGLKLIFVAHGGASGVELYQGGGYGANLLKDINSSSAPFNSSHPRNFVKIGNEMYFSASNSFMADEIWKTNGTVGGTVKVKNFPINPYFYDFENFTEFNNQLFFTSIKGDTTNNSNSVILWKSDGTSVGTVVVKDIESDPFNLSISNLFNFNGTLLFQANDSINGAEIWKSDGTEAGTVMLKDINPTSNDGSNPSNFFINNNEAYFSADDGVNGRELWKTDGTESGTVLVEDINTSDASSPSNLISLGDELYFSANDGTGFELWKHTPLGIGAGTAINNIAEMALSVHPNPTSGKVVFNTKEQITSIEIFDLKGQKMKTYAYTNSIDLSSVPKGIYFAKIINVKNEMAIKKVALK